MTAFNFKSPVLFLLTIITYQNFLKAVFQRNKIWIRSRLRMSRSSHSHMFFKTGVLKNFAIFTGKHLCFSLFLIELQAFFRSSFFYRIPPVVAFKWRHYRTTHHYFDSSVFICRLDLFVPNVQIPYTLYPLKNIRKSYVFLMFSGGIKCNIGNKRVNHVRRISLLFLIGTLNMQLHNRSYMKWTFVFSPNTGKFEPEKTPEKIRIRTLFMHCPFSLLEPKLGRMLFIIPILKERSGLPRC